MPDQIDDKTLSLIYKNYDDPTGNQAVHDAEIDRVAGDNSWAS